VFAFIGILLGLVSSKFLSKVSAEVCDPHIDVGLQTWRTVNECAIICN